ncbi:ECM3 [Candida margitis]|uniref:ECM3 n=1 Tax=Candida margitis TaxID=1775924 RepID=UPI0022273705|nr:ECM3 [Candida margitis]KAI5954088.1 ECM3 [Candida margitis]
MPLITEDIKKAKGSYQEYYFRPKPSSTQSLLSSSYDIFKSRYTRLKLSILERNMSDSESLSLGLVIYSAVKPIFKIYFIIAIGFILAKRNILTVTTCRDISDTIVTAIMPCLIFNNMVSYLKSSDIKNVGIIIFTSCLLFTFGGFSAYGIHLITKSPKRWLGGLISVGIFPNISDLPIAYLQTFAKGGTIFTSAEGNKGVAYVCIFLMGMTLLQFSFGLFRLIQWDFRDELKGQDLERSASGETNESNKSFHERDDSEEKSTRRASNDERETIRAAAHTRDSTADEEALDSSSDSISSESSEEERRRMRRRRSIMDEDRQHNEFLRAQSKRQEGSSVSGSATLSRRTSRRRRGSDSSATSGPLDLVPPRTNDLRRQQSQNVEDVIHEYSEFESLKYHELQKSHSKQEEEAEPEPDTPEAEESKFKSFVKKMLQNLRAPTSVSLLTSIAICMAPPLKALFVTSTFSKHIPNAPDKQPPLSFIIDLVSYVGNASVPLGLLLLGATLARLQVKRMPPGFWKTAVLITFTRLVILPIFGVGVTTGFNNGGWYGDDKLVRFVSVLEFGLPNATSLVYFTAFYTDPTSDEHLQMDCLAICLITQYLILWFTLPFLITFTLKVSMVRRTVLATVSAPFRSEQFQIALKCVLGFVFVLFVDSVNRVYAVTSELTSATQAHPGTSIMNDRSEIQARRFYAQRNMYLCGFTLFLTLILTRTYNLVVELIATKDKVDALKENNAEAGSATAEDSEELAKLKAQLAEKERTLETLKSQASTLGKDYEGESELKERR